MRRLVTLLALALLAAPAAAQTTGGTGRAWQFTAYVDLYHEPGEATFLIPTLFADRGALHLEARYNYEDYDTGSLFAGRTFTFGSDTTYLKLTPMIGVFFGTSRGVAPAVEVEAGWRRLAWWLEAEYAVDPGDSANNFFYSWSELNWYVRDWLWVGASAQRMRLVDTPREVDLAPMIGFGGTGDQGLSLSLYAYGLGTTSTWYLATLAVGF